MRRLKASPWFDDLVLKELVEALILVLEQRV